MTLQVSCVDLLTKTGWHCAPVRMGAREALYVSTPLTMRDGKPYDFYIEQHGATIVLDDDGLTMFSLRGMGYPMDDGRSWRGLRSIAESLGCSLGDDGAFCTTSDESRLADATARMLRLFCAISSWEEEKCDSKDIDLTLTLEVERLMREKAPLRLITNDPVFEVQGNQIRFDYLWGDTYVDVVAAQARSVNPRLRKAILTKSEAPILFIVDDRDSIKKADQEVALLGAVAQAVRLGNFREFYTPPLAA